LNLDELIQACKKNDRNAQKELYNQYKTILYMVSLKYCRNVADAEDNLHDAFITIFNSIKTYKNLGSFEGWLKRIAINKAIDRYKKGKSTATTQIIDDLLEDTSFEEIKTIPFDTILETIQQLPDQYRLVFNLYELDGYSHKEISKLLSISEGTSKSNLHRAKAILKKQLIDTGFKSQTNQ